MKKFTKGISVLICTATLVAVSALAQAETRFAVQDSTGVDKMVVTDKGQIGVGTTTPTTGIQVKGNTMQSAQIVSHYTGPESILSGGFLAYKNNVNGITPILPKKGDRIGYMLFGSIDTDGVSQRNSAGLVGYAEADWTSTSIPGYFLFEVTPQGSTGRMERMRITSAGNVGIGSPTPTQKLEVNGGIRLNTATAKPACNNTSNTRGVIWMTQGGVGTADSFEVCAKDANGVVSWVNLY